MCNYASVIVDTAVYIFLACSSAAVTFAHEDDLWLREGCPSLEKTLESRLQHATSSGEQDGDDDEDEEDANLTNVRVEHLDGNNDEMELRDPSLVVTEKTHDHDFDDLEKEAGKLKTKQGVEQGVQRGREQGETSDDISLKTVDDKQDLDQDLVQDPDTEKEKEQDARQDKDKDKSRSSSLENDADSGRS